MIIFLEPGAREYGEILAAPIPRVMVPVVPSLPAGVMPVLSRFGIKLLASLENLPKECRSHRWLQVLSGNAWIMCHFIR